MTGDEKKKRDPIFTVCFVIFMLAAVGVIGVYVNEHYIQKDNTIAGYGDDVTVNYTGTFYAYYGEENAVVFDTTYSSIGNNGDVDKANTYSKTSYSTISFTIGDGDYLKAFEEAIAGHKVGDVVRVEIPDAYPAPESSMYEDVSMNGLTIPQVQQMAKEQFESVYPDVSISTGSSAVITTVYGWQASVYHDATDNMYYVTNMPSAGSSYEYDASVGNEDYEDKDVYGKVTFNVTGISNGVITYNLSVTDTTVVDESTHEIKMVEILFGTETWYITNINGSTMDYKTCEETRNATLYFEIEIVSID